MRSPLLTLCALVAMATFSTQVWAGGDPSADNAPSDQQNVVSLDQGNLQDFGNLDGSGWHTRAPIPAVNGTSQTTTASDCFGYVYVIGGGTGTGPDITLNLLQRYSPGDNTWTNMANIPTPLRAFGAVALVDGDFGAREKFYVFGGFDGTAPTNTLRIYNTITDTWSTGASIPPTGGGFGVGVCQVGNRIFLAGGSNNFTAGMEYHVDTNTYTDIAPMGSGGAYRTHCAGVDSAQECHCFGNGFDSNQHFVYHVATNTWTNGTVMPLGVTDPAVASLDPLVYVVGGSVPSTPAWTQIWDTSTNTWSRGPNLPTSLNNTSGTIDLGVSPPTLFVEGGYDGVGSVPYNYSLALP